MERPPTRKMGESEIGENFMDFYNRISKNYEKIMTGELINLRYNDEYFKLALK